MTRWCHHLKGPCWQNCIGRCQDDPVYHLRSYGDVTEKGLLRLTKPRWRWDVPPGFYIVIGVMALLGTWALLAIVWIYQRWPGLWS